MSTCAGVVLLLKLVTIQLEGNAIMRLQFLCAKEASLNEYIGKNVSLEGLALDAKLGAVVKLQSAIIYVHKLEAWPSTYLNKIVRVRGTLAKRKLAPDPISNRGIVLAGLAGDSFIIENPQWSITKPKAKK